GMRRREAQLSPPSGAGEQEEKEEQRAAHGAGLTDASGAGDDSFTGLSAARLTSSGGWRAHFTLHALERSAHSSQPLSNTMRHTPGDSCRHTELKRETSLPARSRTGPLLCASVPEASTSTSSGSHENGASGFS